MKELLEQVAGGHQFYHVRSPEYASTDTLPFRISPEPFYVSDKEAQAIELIGQEISGFMLATNGLYATNETAHELLDRGKPEFFLNNQRPDYMFLRPDMVVTPDGFTICEIETSVFGLALAELLNQGYISAGFETMTEETTLRNHVASTLPAEGTLVYTDKTKAFAGQLEFLAKQVFSGDDRHWQIAHAGEVTNAGSIYRAHYLVEYLSDMAVRTLYDRPGAKAQTMPSLTPQFEEKAILAFIWDKRFEDYYRNALGYAGFDLLRSVIPPTWIVGQEAYFAPGLPGNLQESVDLAGLSRSKRTFVLKPSGFSPDSSWSEGVSFLQSKSHDDARQLLEHATINSAQQLYVVQEFKEGVKRIMSYDSPEGIVDMQARVRLTPYFSTMVGKLLGIKATGCEGTQLIHATTASINTAVSIK